MKFLDKKYQITELTEKHLFVKYIHLPVEKICLNIKRLLLSV